MSGTPTVPPPGPSRELAAAFGRRAWNGRLRLRWTDRGGVKDVVVERTTVLGSSENVDVLVDHPTVSRVHAEIEIQAHDAWVRDLGSSNGTFVDRVRVKSARIEAGQTLRLGSAEVVVEEIRDEAAALATAFGAANGPDLWPEPTFGPLVGHSVEMRELFATLAKVAATDIPVFLRGETGSGKELVARAIHEASSRAGGPYGVVDCAALTESLLEAELFGHARGAFTGATSAREGAIEAADGGTVFLDEIGELPLEMQPKLLRVLESRTVRRIGEAEYRHVDVRFIAATHRDLVDYVARGWFREDLYFRLAVLPVRIPPLRERLDDLEALVRHFLGPSAGSLVTPALLSTLAARPWKGNVRELRNFLDRARTLGLDRALAGEGGESGAPSGTRPAAPGAAAGFGSGVTVTEMALPPGFIDLSHREFRDRWADIGERTYLRAKLKVYGGNVSRMSREIELARTYTHKLIKKHGL